MLRRFSNPLIELLVRNLKRFLILLLGVYIAFFVSWQLFPAINNQTPWLIALLLTYAVTAYVLLPSAIRVAHTLFKPKHIPHHTVTPDGFANDPINISFVGTRHQIITAMRKAGWHLADKRTPRNLVRMMLAALLRRPYPNAPFSSLYLFGRSQDLGFQKQIDSSVTHRHHFRLWACTNRVDSAFRDDVFYWLGVHKELDKNQKLLWVGAAVLDEGLGLIRYHGQITHSINPDTNAERDLIVKDLKKAKVLKEVLSVKAGQPTVRDNRVIGDEMISDGALKVCILA